MDAVFCEKLAQAIDYFSTNLGSVEKFDNIWETFKVFICRVTISKHAGMHRSIRGHLAWLEANLPDLESIHRETAEQSLLDPGDLIGRLWQPRDQLRVKSGASEISRREASGSEDIRVTKEEQEDEEPTIEEEDGRKTEPTGAGVPRRKLGDSWPGEPAPTPPRFRRSVASPVAPCIIFINLIFLVYVPTAIEELTFRLPLHLMNFHIPKGMHCSCSDVSTDSQDPISLGRKGEQSAFQDEYHLLRIGEEEKTPLLRGSGKGQGKGGSEDKDLERVTGGSPQVERSSRWNKRN
ncbi:hypothetical protein NDU88_004734 [Pleurodeles waltl]|uniref:Uncharacterized protein n=1 Tax=Pleurodeles waltl TaxID=8319 RepID=A0AAV7RMD3_PLEWA|nr:hypothetical protein NDU88_004734 [Pleurodeles waltl]